MSLLSIEYNDSDLNDIEGIAGITSKKKVHYFLHEKTKFLCLKIYDQLKAIDTKSAIQQKINELTHDTLSGYKSSLLVHKTAHLMALKTWNKQKKKAQDQEIHVSADAQRRHDSNDNLIDPTHTGNITQIGVRRIFQVKHLKHGASLTRIKGFKTLRKAYFVRPMVFKEVQDFYEEKYRKNSGGTTARMFLEMANVAHNTRKGFAKTSGMFRQGSNYVDYDFQDTSVEMEFHSYAFGKKHFPAEVYEINPWFNKTTTEGKDMYSGSRNEKAIKQGIKDAYNDVYNHVKQKGVLYQ